MSFQGLTDPTAVEDEYGNAIVRFENGQLIECQSMIEAEALAEAWRQWPFSGHRPVEESRSRWRTGFADGAAWAASRQGVVAEEPEPSDQVKQLIRDMTDPDDCWFDHHGGCQAHGYLSLQPGEKCPHAEAKELLASWVPVKQEGEKP